MPSQLKKRALRPKAEVPESAVEEGTARLATPEEYNAFIGAVELRMIRLAHCELNARTRHEGGPLEPHVEDESTTYRHLEDGFLVFHALKFSGVPTEGNGDPIVVRATFELEYA